MQTQPTIALLSPGDMGTQISKSLIKNKFNVITAGDGRSQQTLDNIRNTGIKNTGSLENTVEKADIILSLTSPEASLEMAEKISFCLQNSNKKPLYVDLNSNTPDVALAIEKLFASIDIPFINGAVMGASKDIPETAVFVLSGIHRKRFSDLFGHIFKIKDAGEKTEAASAYKLLFSMVNKGMNALFFETMTAASHFGILDELNDSLQEFLPGTYQDLMKTTPTYPQHLFRRIDEMKGLSQMLENENLPNVIASGIAKTFKTVYQSQIFEGEEPKNVIETFQNFKKLK